MSVWCFDARERLISSVKSARPVQWSKAARATQTCENDLGQQLNAGDFNFKSLCVRSLPSHCCRATRSSVADCKLKMLSAVEFRMLVFDFSVWLTQSSSRISKILNHDLWGENEHEAFNSPISPVIEVDLQIEANNWKTKRLMFTFRTNDRGNYFACQSGKQSLLAKRKLSSS